MKTLLVAGMIAVAGIASAQSKPAATTERAARVEQPKRDLTPEDRAMRVLRMMSYNAKLTDAQQADVKPILIEREKTKMSTTAGKSGSKDPATKEMRRKAQQDADVKLKEILSPEQWGKWEAYRADQKAKRAEMKKGMGSSKELTPEQKHLQSNPANTEDDFY